MLVCRGRSSFRVASFEPTRVPTSGLPSLHSPSHHCRRVLASNRSGYQGLLSDSTVVACSPVSKTATLEHVMTVPSRSLSRQLAPLVAELELRQPVLVSLQGAGGPRRGSGTAHASQGGRRAAARDRLASAHRPARRLSSSLPALMPARTATAIRSSTFAPPCRPGIPSLSRCRVPCGCTGLPSGHRTGMSWQPRLAARCLSP